MEPSLTIQVLDPKLAICRLAGDAALPEWCSKGSFVSITRTPDELSLVCEEVLVPEAISLLKQFCHIERNPQNVVIRE
jgi:hypothetical protein